MQKSPATVGTPRYCLERVAGEWLQGSEGEPLAAKLANLDDAKLARVVEKIIETKCQRPMPRLRELLEKLAQAGPKEGDAP